MTDFKSLIYYITENYKQKYERIVMKKSTAHFHLPGLFEFYEFYKVFLLVFYSHREWFYDWVDIASIYGSPADCLWGGGRVGFGDDDAEKVISLLNEYKISARLTFSNSLLKDEHLSDKKCNRLCKTFEKSGGVKNGVIIYSDLLLNYIKENYPDLYFVSSTTKVLTEFYLLKKEIERPEFSFVVPDFRLNRDFENLNCLNDDEKDKVEFLVNECCWTGCSERRVCYETVSRKSLGQENIEHICRAPGGSEGYRFSKAMKSPAFIGTHDIENIYLASGFSNFKIEGRGLGSAVLLEFLLYYLVKPEFMLEVREAVYLDSQLDLF